MIVASDCRWLWLQNGELVFIEIHIYNYHKTWEGIWCESGGLPFEATSEVGGKEDGGSGKDGDLADPFTGKNLARKALQCYSKSI